MVHFCSELHHLIGWWEKDTQIGSTAYVVYKVMKTLGDAHNSYIWKGLSISATVHHDGRKAHTILPYSILPN